MSRIGRQPITLPVRCERPAGRSVQLTVTWGPRGTLHREIPEPVTVRQDEAPPSSSSARTTSVMSRGLLHRPDPHPRRATWSPGVTEGFQKDLEIVGVGYRVQRPQRDPARARARL